MRQNASPQMIFISGQGAEPCGSRAPSENGQLHFPAEVPDFVRRALALGYEEAGVWALYRRITKTRQDVRTRRITPAGGCRRVDRLALAVAIAKAAGVAP